MMRILTLLTLKEEVQSSILITPSEVSNNPTQEFHTIFILEGCLLLDVIKRSFVFYVFYVKIIENIYNWHSYKRHIT